MNNDYISNQINEAIAKIEAAKQQELAESVQAAETQILAGKNAEFTEERDRAIAAARQTCEYAITVANESCEQKKAAYREQVIGAIRTTIDAKYAATIQKLRDALPVE